MGWIYLIISIVFETGWAMTLKPTEGYTRLLPSCLNFIIALGGIFTLSQALKTIPTNVGYSVFIGVSLVFITALGHFIYNEPLESYRLLFFGLIFTGVIGLKLVN